MSTICLIGAGIEFHKTKKGLKLMNPFCGPCPVKKEILISSFYVDSREDKLLNNLSSRS